MILAILWAIFIWSNSLQGASASSESSTCVVELFEPLLELFGLSEDLQHTLVRKAAHVVEFAILSVLWAGALTGQGQEESRSRWVQRGWVLFLCLLVALVDETIQRFVPGRSSEVLDVWIDVLGSALGVIAVVFVKWLHKKLKQKKPS